MEFMRSYLFGSSLVRHSASSGMAYVSTAVEWAKYVREMFTEYVYVEILQSEMKLSGDVEIDECLFGRKWKYQRGKNMGTFDCIYITNYTYSVVYNILYQ